MKEQFYLAEDDKWCDRALKFIFMSWKHFYKGRDVVYSFISMIFIDFAIQLNTMYVDRFFLDVSPLFK